MKLSAIIITKNAEKQIGNAITSVSFADEIIVVDSGSTDNTAKIAKELKAIVFHHEWKDFSDARNFGLNKAHGDWVLYIDSDEVVSDELKENMQQKIQQTAVSAYKLQRKNYYLGNNPWPKVELLERLFKKDSLKGWYGAVHESPKIVGKIETVNGYLYHYSHQDLSSMLEKTIMWSKTEAALRFNAQHPQMTLWRFPRVMIPSFFNSYISQGGYKVGTTGLIESIYQAFSTFVTYARLWEMQHNQKDK